MRFWLPRRNVYRDTRQFTGQCKSEAPLHALSDKLAEVEGETLYKTLSDVRDETLGEVLRDTLAKDGGQNTW